MCKLERALLATVQERNSLNVYMEGIGASLAKALEEPVQEYKANFKETDDYLDHMQDATKEYKAQLKKVNPDFDAEHYDRLILGLDEPQTPAPEEPVGFD